MAPENTLQAERSDISSDPDTSTQVKYVVPGKYYPMLNVGKEEIARQQPVASGMNEQAGWVLGTLYSHKVLKTSRVIFITSIYLGSWLSEKPTATLDFKYVEECH